MALFVLTCMDHPDSLDRRMAVREDHLAYARSRSGVLKLGGPFLSEAGEMIGSLMIIEVEDLAAARAFNAADPYQKAGLFQSVDIKPFRVSLVDKF
jgi:uncharacterized protein